LVEIGFTRKIKQGYPPGDEHEATPSRGMKRKEFEKPEIPQGERGFKSTKESLSDDQKKGEDRG